MIEKPMLTGKKILLIISGGIAAYKSLELIRGLKKAGACVRCIMTQGGQQFVTPLSVAALTEEPVYTDLFSLKDETEMGHIRLSREADLILVAPASANIMAQMAHGLAEDLASTTLLATNDDATSSTVASAIQFTASADATYYIKTYRYEDTIPIGRYGDFDLTAFVDSTVEDTAVALSEVYESE
jgi:phosphopantothenoylcysteine decarboxylase/phosphopantothenate--cysteine ligase